MASLMVRSWDHSYGKPAKMAVPSVALCLWVAAWGGERGCRPSPFRICCYSQNGRMLPSVPTPPDGLSSRTELCGQVDRASLGTATLGEITPALIIDLRVWAGQRGAAGSVRGWGVLLGLRAPGTAPMSSRHGARGSRLLPTEVGRVYCLGFAQQSSH